MASSPMRSDWRKFKAWVSRWVRRGRRGRDRVRRTRRRASAGWLRLTGRFRCSICGQEFSNIDRDNHLKAHAAVGDKKPKNLVNDPVHQEKQRSKVVERELERRRQREAATVASPTPEPPTTTRPPTVAEKIRKAWGHKINDKGAVMAGTTTPKTPSEQQMKTGPAAGFYAAAQAFADAEPRDHEEMRDLMLAFHAGMEAFARGIEAFQDRQVNRGFHPATMRPLEIAVNGVGDGATGFTQTLVAIERFYAANFEAAQNPGPGESFFGATPPAGNGNPSGRGVHNNAGASTPRTPRRTAAKPA